MIMIFFICITLKFAAYEKYKISYADKFVAVGEEVYLLLSSTAPETDVIFRKLKKLDKLKNFDFDSFEDTSPLTPEENEAAREFICSIGRYDVDTQMKCAAEFAESFKRTEEKYRLNYEKNHRIYYAFGICVGALVSLLVL